MARKPETGSVPTRIALVQLARARSRPHANRARMLGLLDRIRDADLVCLPEAWLGGYVLPEQETGPLLSELGLAARNGGFTLITGGLFVTEGDAVKGVCHIIDPQGRVAARVGKRFPSKAVGERGLLKPEPGPSLVRRPGLPCFGVSICIDIIYPGPVRAMALDGMKLLFNPANIPANRGAFWRSIAAVRAGENTVFSAFVNNCRTRYPDRRAVKGGSVVCAPDGEIVASAGEDETVLRADLDMSAVDRQRLRWPYISDCRDAGCALATDRGPTPGPEPEEV